MPLGRADRTHVYHLYTIRHPRRDALAAHLNANGVQTAINYPMALPFLEAYPRLKHRPEQFPERVSATRAGSCRCRCLRKSRASNRPR